MPPQMQLEMPAEALSRVPPWFRQTISCRGVWNLCTLERSCFGPVHDATPAAPFHHISVRLDDNPLKMGWTLDGRKSSTDLPQDHVSVLPAGAYLNVWWNRPIDFACLYFTLAALAAAAGEELASATKFEVRASISAQAPTLSRLVRALHQDAAQGHPYSKMRGDSIFISIAGLLAHDKRLFEDRAYRQGIGDWRVRRALAYIHAHGVQAIDVASVAKAAETSPFHLARSFRPAVGCSIWQYVLRYRVQVAAGLIRDRELTLAQVASLSGFESYSSFAASFKTIRGLSPARFRAAL